MITPPEKSPAWWSSGRTDSGGKAMATEATRRAVWNDLLDVSRVARYAEAMGSQYRVRHLFIRLGLLVAASGSMATFLDPPPPPPPPSEKT